MKFIKNLFLIKIDNGQAVNVYILMKCFYNNHGFKYFGMIFF